MSQTGDMMAHHFLDSVGGRVLYGIIVVAPIVVAIARREARRSRFVRAGGALLLLSVVLAMLAQGLLTFVPSAPRQELATVVMMSTAVQIRVDQGPVRLDLRC